MSRDEMLRVMRIDLAREFMAAQLTNSELTHLDSEQLAKLAFISADAFIAACESRNLL